ncbi:MAG: hypothetical protein CVV64_16690 [Candidatus Wallbacteria bacterium HGW-Wallbacteria-1]|jgi:hypothetical protein|uniref:Uncharacterized protein n=1 Tax=Candidatus Wallbacteria bacterium HGW-Wallbacteria-1 TaxID=2013854 RepID=A0A2N1PKN0_9BACT|nr:MAG: hypothetical protein CVV64_16690 [Candidatus Wallbacteria bacterium HGW-Wallbacteria-1]
MNPKVYIENAHGPISFSPKSVSIQTTIIGKLVRLLSMEGSTITSDTRPGVTPDIQKKIDHNNVCHEAWLIYRYSEYGRAIEIAYHQLNQDVNNGRNKALRKIHDLYKEELASNSISLLNPELNKIRSLADTIVKKISTKLIAFVKTNDASLQDIHMEDLEFGINLIIGHAFVECIILEAPQ